MSLPVHVRICLFDGLSIEASGGRVTRFRTQKTAGLTAYLAYFLGKAHRRDGLAQLFWPEDDGDAARNSLTTALWSLRKSMEELGLDREAVFVADRVSVRLNPLVIRTDVAEFSTALQAAAAAPSAAAKVEALSRAVDAYRGELLPGYLDEWVFAEQARLASQFVRAVTQLVALLEQQGNFEAAIEHAARASALDPLSEASRLCLMRCYAATGHTAAALAQYRDLERRMRQELDAAPGVELRSLAWELESRPASAASRIDAVSAAAAREGVDGAVPLESVLYVPRETDTELREAISRRESIVLIKGPRQSGKSSLLARGFQQARASGSRVVLTDLQMLSAAQMGSLDDFFQSLAECLAERLDLSVFPQSVWERGLGPNLNLRRYVRKYVLPPEGGHLVWGLDEVDRLFHRPFGTEVFALFRSWHNERAMDPGGPWQRLTLVLSYATEAHLFLADLNMSPFNIGTRLFLKDFTAEQVDNLNTRCGRPLRDAPEMQRFLRLVGGHPYLVRRALHELSGKRVGPSALEAEARREELFEPHLRRIRLALSQDAGLCAEVRRLVQGNPVRSEEAFYRLRSAGLLSGDSPEEARFRCGLYAAYLARSLPAP